VGVSYTIGRMNTSDIKITDLIPQRHPVVMIDSLEEVSAGSAVGSLLVRASNIFTARGHFTEAGITEFIAQTAAAFKGFQKVSSKEEVKKGYIAAVKNLKIFSLPPVGCELRCSINVDNELIGYTIISGKVYLEKQLIAEAEMRIILEC
jgi:predicted hotdog family 3-hydroxylacyl-ACP dehydratase